MNRFEGKSRQEIEHLLETVDPNDLSFEEVETLESISADSSTFEQSIKLIINSIYGAFANEYFHFYNVDIAETITLQGQDAIKHTERMIEKYFHEFFHKDKKLHAALGLPDDFEVPQIINSVWKYTDTDSFRGDAIIRTESGPIQMKDLYEKCLIENGPKEETQAGHESTSCSSKVLNWTSDKKLHLGRVKRLIRHKVSKPKWKIKTKTGKEIEVTNDHSMVVFRDGKQLTVKPSEILNSDKILCVGTGNYYFDEIESCEQVGQFEDELVYDIEMEDESHTFIANDMLIHNSGYLIFEEVMEAVQWKGGVKDFVLKLNEVRIADYIKKVLDKYAESFNVESYLDFELETIAENAIWVAKKKYIQNIIWKDGKDYNPSFIKTTGLELIQSSTPTFCREKLKEVMQYIFDAGNTDIETYSGLIRMIKQMKKQFTLSNVEQVAKGSSVSKYNKYILDDVEEFTVESGCPIHIRAAGYHNYLINQDPKLKGKYQLINSGDKIKWYFTQDDFCDVFAFKAGEYPIEIAPKIDIERQFTKTFLEVLNRIIVPAGYQELNPTLAYTVGLF